MAEIIKISNNEELDIAVNRAIEELDKGNIIVYPTDTIYGLGCDVENDSAVKKIYEIKGRKESKPLLCLAANEKMVSDYTKDISARCKEIMSVFWPGPLTLVLEKNDKISSLVSAESQTIGFRVPSSDFCCKMINGFGKPVVSTSINKSESTDYYEINQLPKDILKNISLVIDLGILKNKIPSTVVSFLNNDLKIIREGSITKDIIAKKLKIKFK